MARGLAEDRLARARRRDEVPADVRQREGTAGRGIVARVEAANGAGEDAEPALAGRLFAPFEEHLETEADAEVRRARADALDERLAETSAQGRGERAERALSRDDDPIDAP